MRRLLAPLLCLFLLAGISPLDAAETITLTLPEAVIARAASAVLPLPIDARSKSVQGDITIIAIDNLRLSDQHLACRLQLSGQNLSLVTEIAGHEIRLKVGSVTIDFSAIAEIRFDPASQTLFVRPVVQDVAAIGSGANADIGQALVALLNGREFPLAIHQLDPLIAETGSKTVTINTRITSIEAKPAAIELRLLPEVTAR
jgi:hypothetical protein